MLHDIQIALITLATLTFRKKGKRNIIRNLWFELKPQFIMLWGHCVSVVNKVDFTCEAMASITEKMGERFFIIRFLFRSDGRNVDNCRLVFQTDGNLSQFGTRLKKCTFFVEVIGPLFVPFICWLGYLI